MSTTPNYLNFVEERLDLGYDYGARGGPEWRTDAFELGDGSEQRISKWSLPLGRWQLGDQRFDETEAEPINYLRAFFDAREGATEGFRWKDWSDYELDRQSIGTGDGSNADFQIYKRYSATPTDFCDRPLQKIVSGSVTAWVDGVETTAYTIDLNTGVITFDSPPPNNDDVEVQCEFDVIVFFEQSEFPIRFLGTDGDLEIWELGSLSVKEERLPLPDGFQVGGGSGQVAALLDLGIIPNTVETVRYGISQQATAAGFRRRSQDFTDSRTRLNVGDFQYSPDQIRELQNFAYCARGSGRAFYVKHLEDLYVARFLNDSPLDIRFDGDNLLSKIFTIPGIEFISTENPPESTIAIVNRVLYVAQDGPIRVATVASNNGAGASPACSYTGEEVRITYQNYERQFTTFPDFVLVPGDITTGVVSPLSGSMTVTVSELEMIALTWVPVPGQTTVPPGTGFGNDTGTPQRPDNPYGRTGPPNFRARYRRDGGNFIIAGIGGGGEGSQYGGRIVDVEVKINGVFVSSSGNCPAGAQNTYQTAIYDNSTIFAVITGVGTPEVAIL